MSQFFAMNDTHRLFEACGLVDIQSLCPDVMVDLRYARADNFIGVPVYADISRAYAVPDLARRIAGAQRELANRRPSHTLLIWDAARPLSVQRRFYDAVRDTDLRRYVADPDDPSNLGMHNFGMAVDCTIAGSDGLPIDMGGGFDEFSPISHTGNELQMLADGMLSQEAFDNRMLLFSAMATVGLKPHPYEWWHFQLPVDPSADPSCKILDF